MPITAPASPAPPMELLAPAGTLPAFEAAIEAGADAVYVGAPGLNARALTRDFTFAEIAAMTDHAHGRGKKLYVAMNSLLKEDEIRLALETLSMLARIGPDGLIIQDLGILYLVRRFFPQLPVHASTLMTVNHSTATAYLQGLGFERIVLARELSLAEIRTIHERSQAGLEIFIHGAMCFSYSGLCRFSSLHGGKSSLRGQCVQPCRRRYDWLPSGKRASGGHEGKGGYLFSMNDLSGIDHLAEAREAGVVSLKIEGRLRSVAYVRNTVRAYRLALDALDAPPDQRSGMLADAHQLLDAAMGRKRASGFLLAGQEDRMIVPRLSGSTGEVVGKVVRVDEPRRPGADRTVALQVVLQAPVRLGDRLRLYEERTGDRKSFTLRALEVKGSKVDQASGGQTVTIRLADIEPGSLRHPFHGRLFRVDISGRAEKSRSGLAGRAARLQLPSPDPSNLEKLLAALGMGAEGESTSGGRAAGRHPGGRRGQSHDHAAPPEWWLKVHTPEALALRYPFKVSKVLLEINPRTLAQFFQARRKNRSGQPSLVWAMPPILGEEQLSWYGDAIHQLRLHGEERFQVSHIGQVGLFGEAGQLLTDTHLELYGDYSCNVLNSAALRMYAASCLAGVQFSLETDRATLAGALAHFSRSVPLSGRARTKVGLYVHGRPPLFSSRLDAPHFQGQRTFASPRGERFYLDRRENTLYAFSHTTFSLLPYVDELKQRGIDYFVVDISHGQPKKVCAEVTALLSGRGEVPPAFSGNYTGALA